MLKELDQIGKAREFIECGHAATYDQAWNNEENGMSDGEKAIRVLLELAHFHIMVLGFTACLDITEEQKEGLLAFSREQIYTFIDYHKPKENPNVNQNSN